MGIGCNHDSKFVDTGDEGTCHCVYCRCLVAERDAGQLRKLLWRIAHSPGRPWPFRGAEPDTGQYREWHTLMGQAYIEGEE